MQSVWLELKTFAWKRAWLVSSVRSSLIITRGSGPICFRVCILDIVYMSPMDLCEWPHDTACGAEPLQMAGLDQMPALDFPTKWVSGQQWQGRSVRHANQQGAICTGACACCIGQTAQHAIPLHALLHNVDEPAWSGSNAGKHAS